MTWRDCLLYRILIRYETKSDAGWDDIVEVEVVVSVVGESEDVCGLLLFTELLRSWLYLSITFCQSDTTSQSKSTYQQRNR